MKQYDKEAIEALRLAALRIQGLMEAGLADIVEMLAYCPGNSVADGRLDSTDVDNNCDTGVQEALHRSLKRLKGLVEAALAEIVEMLAYCPGESVADGRLDSTDVDNNLEDARCALPSRSKTKEKTRETVR